MKHRRPGLNLPITWIVGSVALVGAGFHYAFRAIDELGLVTQETTAKIIGMGYRKGGSSYISQLSASQPPVPPQETPDEYLLKLDLEGEQTTCAVPRDLYQSVKIQDTLQVRYQRRRVTGTVHIVELKR